MAADPPTYANWYRAAALDERVDLRRRGALSSAVDDGRAARRDRRWRADRAFAGPIGFDQRLRAAGLSDDEFLAALGAAQPPAAPMPEPRWLQTFHDAFAPRADEEPRPAPRDLDGLAIIEPLIAQALERAIRRARRLLAEGPVVDPDQLRALLDDALPRARLRSMLARTLVLELNVARLRDDLTGETPHDRYADFIRRLADPAYAARVLQEYPVLARQLVETLDAWVTCQTEFLERLSRDWPAVCTSFFPDAAPGPLVAITPPQGDLHSGGRAVLIAQFAGGHRLVYKPRSLAVEVHFGALVTWLNARLGGLRLAAPAVLDRGEYGWAAFAEHAACATEAEVREFYTRLGGLTALMTVLDATDIHSENLIAHGAHPLLIDLECLFHPRAYVHLGADGQPLAEDDEFYTVLRTGILPARSWADGVHAGIDTSAMGGATGQELPDPALRLEHAGTDESRFVAGRATLTDHGRHRPTLGGAAVAAEDYDDAMVAGFEAVYRCVLAHRADFGGPGGPLEAFAGDEIRVLVRDTRTYGLLLDDALHPDYLRDALDRDQLFDRLWAEVARRPYYASLIASEQADLRVADVPMFTTRTNARDLWDSRGRRIPNLFDRSSMEMVQRQVARLSEEDLLRQTWAIRASFDAVRMNRGEPPRAPLAPIATDDAASSLGWARAIGDRLDVLAIRGEAMACWAGLLRRQGAWSADIVDHSLHSGTGGIALFLGHLGAATGERRYTELARMAVETVCFVSAKRLREGVGPGNIGLYFGWGGVFHVLASASVLWSTPRYLDLVRQLIPALLGDVERHRAADLAGGVAGFLLGLMTTYRVSPDPAVRDAAITCGDRLLQLAHSTPTGLSWTDESERRAEATSFARGDAGIAYVLSLLSDAVDEPRFREAAAHALTHARHRRETSRADGAMAAGWATGAAGVGLVSLAELATAPLGAGAADRTRDVAAAIDQLANHRFGADHSLGSGDLGCLELLLQSRGHASFPTAGADQARQLADMLAGATSTGWRSGLPGGRETPGLVDGLAGIGYQLLRMAAPDRIPPAVLAQPSA